MEKISHPSKSKSYLIIATLAASFVGWLFLTLVRPVVIERGCSEIAFRSSNLSSDKYSTSNSPYSFEKLKNNCLEEASK